MGPLPLAAVTQVMAAAPVRSHSSTCLPPVVSRGARWLAAAGIALLTLVVAVVALLQVPAVATWVTGRLLALVPLNPGYRLGVERVSGNWLTGLRLEQVRLLRGRRELALVERSASTTTRDSCAVPIAASGDSSWMARRVTARRDGGTWDIANAIRSSGDTSGGRRGFPDRPARRAPRRCRPAMLAPDSTARIRGLTLEGRDLVVGDAVLLTMDTVYASVAPPGEPPLWFEVAAAGAATSDVIRLEPLHIQSHRSLVTGRMVVPAQLRRSADGRAARHPPRRAPPRAGRPRERGAGGPARGRPAAPRRPPARMAD